MVTFTTVPTITTGDVATAAWGNTHIKDNFTAFDDIFDINTAPATGRVPVGDATDFKTHAHAFVSAASLLLRHEVGGLEVDASAFDGFLEIKGGTGSAKKSNLAASAAPGATDDSAAGYAVGSIWIDTTNDQVYHCVDATASAAVWLQTVGKLKQMVSTVTGAVATGTTVMPYDDTIPQNTEGDEYMTLAITPSKTTNKLLIQVVLWGSTSIANDLVVALFQDSVAGALRAASGRDQETGSRHCVSFTHPMDAGTVSATTFKVRAGAPAANTTTFNGDAGARKFGGVAPSSIVIWEVEP